MQGLDESPINICLEIGNLVPQLANIAMNEYLNREVFLLHHQHMKAGDKREHYLTLMAAVHEECHGISDEAIAFA